MTIERKIWKTKSKNYLHNIDKLCIFFCYSNGIDLIKNLKSKLSNFSLQESNCVMILPLSIIYIYIYQYRDKKRCRRIQWGASRCVFKSRGCAQASQSLAEFFEKMTKEFYNIMHLQTHTYTHRATSVSRPRDRGPLPEGCWSLSRHCGLGIAPPLLVDESDVGTSRLLLKTGSILKCF